FVFCVTSVFALRPCGGKNIQASLYHTIKKAVRNGPPFPTSLIETSCYRDDAALDDRRRSSCHLYPSCSTRDAARACSRPCPRLLCDDSREPPTAPSPDRTLKSSRRTRLSEAGF